LKLGQFSRARRNPLHQCLGDRTLLLRLQLAPLWIPPLLATEAAYVAATAPVALGEVAQSNVAVEEVPPPYASPALV